MATPSPKECFYRDYDFSIHYQVDGPLIHVHAYVDKWNRGVLLRGKNIFHKFLQTMRIMGYEAVVTITPNPKFARLYGGQWWKNIEVDGTTYEVYKWELKQLP